ncbi:MAG TPA: SpoIIE family protein phosphatase, partial [Solirubrobacteraceae bacterium]
LELTGVIIAPLRARGRTLGTISFVSAESSYRRFGDEDVALAVELGRRAGMAVDNARLYTARAAIAHTLQSKLLPPRLPEVPGVEIAARYRAAGELIEVGGDFYDVIPLSDGDHLVVVGDVTGKGAEAAAVTALARYTLRAGALHESRPSRMLALLNDALRTQADDGDLCTVCVARVSLVGGRLRVVLSLGGHDPALILRADGRVEEIGRYGSLLGLLEDPVLLDDDAELGPGDVLVLHTDGVTDAGRPQHPVGRDGLARVLERLAGRPPASVVEAVERVAVEAQEGEPRDDIALVALRLEDGMARRQPGSPSTMTFTDVEVPGGPQAPAQARRVLLERLGDEVSDALLEDAGLLVSELVTNSVIHGGAGPTSRVTLRVGIEPERVRIEVTDPGPGFDEATSDPEDPGGYGLFLVTQIADAWGVAGDAEPTQVWFELLRR